MEKIYIITGAAGHLGSTIIRKLSADGETVRGFILPGEKPQAYLGVEYIAGDVRDSATLRPLFVPYCNSECEFTVIHTAGIVDITGDLSPLLYGVNVDGTRNVVAACRKHGVRRLVYVSSVHAIPEKDKSRVQSEVREFSADFVTGGYAKTKAEATRIVLDAAAQGLDAVVVHPSGIIGPYGDTGNHLVQMVSDYISGKLPALVRGGYDFVDVRDVADGCIRAAKFGTSGECYILSNRHYDVSEVMDMIKREFRGRRLPVLPMWMAKAFEPILGGFAKLRHRRPLYTNYSLHALESNDKYSHDKATSELGYKPRELYQTIVDTIMWMTNR
jgi:dihydroflavonol-4-reductase